MNYFKYYFSFLFLVLLFSAPFAAKGQYVSKDEVIVEHKTVKLNLPNTKRVTIVYRPGSNISDTVHVQINNGTYNWTPREAGIVALKTPDGPKQNISVRFDYTPFWGLFIMFGAAFVLFGGATFAAIKLFGKETSQEIAARPDT